MFDRKEVDKFPTSPGVYLMKDRKGTVLYVGKAKNLRTRVRQYFAKEGGDGRPQTPYLLRRVTAIDTVVVTSEKEALLLEDALIKNHQPQYNALLKDDKSFIGLMLTRHKWPMLRIVRYKGKPKENGHFFGPYTSSYSARQTLDLLQKLFPLRRCSDRELASRNRPCILYQIKRCIAPCVNLCTPVEYTSLVEKTARFLKGRDRELIHQLEEEMAAASERLEFERAGQIQETILHLERTLEKQHVHQAGSGDLDVLALHREGGEVALAQLLFREGQLIGAHNYHFSSVIQEDDDLIESFLLQHYPQLPELPHEILVPIPLESARMLEEILGIDRKRRLQIHTPQRGDKRTLIEMAARNAEAAFKRERDIGAIREQTLLQMEERLQLVNYPRRIECFDNAHIAGAEPVSAMVVFIDGEKATAHYRKYKVKSADPKRPDDYSAMYEVLMRRLSRGKAEGDLPDLLLVDGGKGHLNIAKRVLDELNIITVDLVAVAKEGGRHDKGVTQEQLFLVGHKEAVHLPVHSPLLFLLQEIRDEAHRFAVTYHRARRQKRVLESSLDKVPGIGTVKKNRLLRHFGSVKRIQEATSEELAQVQGITQKDIEQLRTHL
jgi:excinuclease ABC subunit C